MLSEIEAREALVQAEREVAHAQRALRSAIAAHAEAAAPGRPAERGDALQAAGDRLVAAIRAHTAHAVEAGTASLHERFDKLEKLLGGRA